MCIHVLIRLKEDAYARDVLVIIKMKKLEISSCLVMNVKVNDMIKTKDGFKKVIYIYTGNECKEQKIASTSTSAGRGGLKVNVIEIKHEKESIVLSYHLIYVKNKIKPMYACQLKIGDILPCDDGDGESRINKIGRKKEFVRSIITENGELFVSGVRTSSFKMCC